MAIDNQAFIILGQDFEDTPNARTLVGSATINVADSGPEGQVALSVTGTRLTSLNSFVEDGIVVYLEDSNQFVGRSLAAGVGIGLDHPTGAGGNPTIRVLHNTTNQLVEVSDVDTTYGSFPNIRFISGGGISIVVSSQDSGQTAEVQLSTSGTGQYVDSIALDSSTGLVVDPTGPQDGVVAINIDFPAGGEQGQFLVVTNDNPLTIGYGDLPPEAVESVEISSSTGLVVDPTGPQEGEVSITVDFPAGGTMGQLLGVTNASPLTIGYVNPPTGDVNSVEISSTTGLAVDPTGPQEGNVNIAIDFPAGGAIGQFLAVTNDSPLTIGYADGGGVTSVEIVSESGLNIDPTGPQDGVVTINVDFPSGATTIGQFLAVTQVSPLTIGYSDPPPGDLPSGIVPLDSIPSTGTTYINGPCKVIKDPNITATSVVMCSGWILGVDGVVPTGNAQAPYIILDPDGYIWEGTPTPADAGFYIVSDVGAQGSGPTASYAIIKY